MPEHRADLVAPGGSYPPMAPLRGAVAGWLPDDPLTPVSTPAAARAVLGAEAQTSVLDPVGLRRLWWQGVHLVVVLVWVGLAVLASVQYLTSDRLPGWWLPFIILVLPLNLAGGYLTVASTRAVPAPGVVPRWGPGRWRWYRDLRRDPVVVPPPAAWPPGSEAYAVLSGAASVESVAPTWLGQQVGLPPDIADQWVAVLRRHGWLAGGGHALGLSRLPELHTSVTGAGRERLEQERARLTTLATGEARP